jgi:hypothetical protein
MRPFKGRESTFSLPVLILVNFFKQLRLDELVKSQEFPFGVIPSRIGVLDDDQAGIQCFQKLITDLDPGFRRGDDFLRVHHVLAGAGGTNERTFC